jgi:hypothetical protein
VGSRVFVGCGRRRDPLESRRRSSHGLVLSFRVLRAPSRRDSFATLSGPTGRHGSSHEVLRPFSVSPHAAAACWPGLPRPTACALRFSQPLDALSRPVPAGLVSCRIRSWGCALQSLPPLAEPCAVSGARSPPDVGWPPWSSPRASRMVAPGVAGLPKHAAPTDGPRVRTSRSPHDPARESRRPPQAAEAARREPGNARAAAAEAVPYERRSPRAPCRRSDPELRAPGDDPEEHPRLQGFSPRENPPLASRRFRPVRGA